MSEMSWQEKFAAINALGEASLMMRKPGDWYVNQPRVETKDEGSSVIGCDYGNGATPEDAVVDHWERIAALPPRWFVVVDSFGPSRRHVRWNGYMWVDVPRDVAASGERGTP